MAAKEVKLSINYMPVQIEGFVRQFIEAVVTGILNSLKMEGEVRDVNLLIDGDTVDITVDNNIIQLNTFVSKFVKNTVIGMVSSLKEVGQIERLEIRIAR